ncbi:MAG: single-stranded-DNA-specific exonuclease RecJ [Planctomycetes bacterium]|jgi:single-stranded-DNA-specific exonuclease|nr:single-stranded-DNA-specific exonuclease RecJ [Planctomycetota bacterium]
MIQKIWTVLPRADEEFFSRFPKYGRILLQLLYNREIREESLLEDFLQEQYNSESVQKRYSPFLFRDMEKVVDLIIKYIKSGQKILVYGDYDADGVTAATVLYQSLKILKADVGIYLPDRVSEGYGLNKKALEQIANQGYKLVITVDTGIRNKEEVIYAQSLSLEVIITDHHVLPETEEDLPPCLIINPADQKEKYPCHYLAGVGVAFKVVCALISRANLANDQKLLLEELNLDLVTIGTVADLVSLTGENRILVKKGLEIINTFGLKRRVGLSELIDIAGINPYKTNKEISVWNIAFQIAPRLNAASRLEHANSAFALLVSKDRDEARQMADDLNKCNAERQKITQEIVAEAEKQITLGQLQKQSSIIVICPEGQYWSEGVIGLVAGMVCEKYHRPTLVITRTHEIPADSHQAGAGLSGNITVFKGSGRSIEGFSLIEVIETCGGVTGYLDKYGGHPMACGFSIIGDSNLENFIAGFKKLSQDKLGEKELTLKVTIDLELALKDLTFDLLSELKELEPYGQNNFQPKFMSRNLAILDIVKMGQESQHIKFRLGDSSSGNSLWALAFSRAEDFINLQIGDRVDLVYYIESNEFNGRRDLQMKIIDLKKVGD